jgi:integrase
MLQSLYRQRLEGMSERPAVSAKTVKNLHGVIHSALKQAVDIDYLLVNPADKCKLPKVTKFEYKPLGDLLPDFLQAIKGHSYELLYLTDLYTGLRESELIGLTWDCVDFDRALIRVYRQFQRVAKECLWLSLKSNKARVIPAPPVVLDVLREQRRRQAEMKLAAGSLWSNPDHLVFTNEIGRYVSYETVYKNFKAIVRTLGAPETRFHDLRHQYAISALQSGVNIKMVQEALGHHTAAFTLDTYACVTGEMQRDAAAKIDAYYKALQTQ